MDFAKIILSDPINQWLFSHVKKDLFLVGGYIRDLLRSGDINKDRDYILKDNIKGIAHITSKQFKGTCIELKKDQMFRVALKSGQFLDFSHMQNTLLEDLGKRDFRINAIAWSPEKGLIDPFDGKTDVTNRIIRMIKPENLAEDPLRVLRAYRLAAQLGFTIDMDTLNYLRKYASHLQEAASERITEELFKLLITENASYYISMSYKHKVLHKILDVSQHNIEDNIALLARFDNFISRLQTGKFKKLFNSRISPVLNLTIGQGLSRTGLIRLSILLNNLHRVEENTFTSLTYSNSIIKRVKKIQDAIMLSSGRLTAGKLYDIFNAADECEFEAAMIVSITRQRNVDKLLKRADDIIKFKRNPLLDGYKIQHVLNIEPTALIGKIQAEIQKRRFLGVIRTKTEALRWIISNFT
ncbi:MAG TPA: hypothetical protein DDX85_08155 [Nitrospiraceae bacterium]|nr:hypothetical protein [Nitrospiraceae bacterium]